MLSYIYGTLAFISMIMAVGFADGGGFLLALVFIGLFWMFYRLSAYEAGMIRKKKNRPR